MEVTQSEEQLVIVQGLFEEELDLSEFSLDVDEEEYNFVEGYSGVSLSNDSGLVVRDSTRAEAVEVYTEVRELLEEDYPDVEFPDPEVVNSATVFELTVGMVKT